MSAICGILKLGDAPLPLELNDRMMRALRKHGPDGSGTWHDSSVALGHQMMHITPESLNEHLPLHHSESQISLSADARLDNREDLLRVMGIATNTELADSELILKAYQKWGKGCADHLVGEFALVIWDGRDRCLHCITDPMGIVPLFYTEVQGRYFAVASEVRALLSLNDNPTPINKRRLAMLGVSALTVYLEPESTCFENIYRVPAATILSVNKTRKATSEYWRPHYKKRLDFKTDEECKEAFREVFFKAVKARLRSAFPVASMLSGGLDSSAIVAAASRILADENKRLVTLSSVPMPGADDRVTGEQEFIELFQGVENLDMCYITAPGCGPFDDLEKLVETASLCSYSFQHFLYTAFVRAARENSARVILDGHGGELSASCYPSGYVAELLPKGRWKTFIRELKYLDVNQRVTTSNLKNTVLRPLLPHSLLKLFNRQRQYNNFFEYPIRESYVREVLGRDVDRVKDDLLRFLVDYPDHRRIMYRNIMLQQRTLCQRSHAGFVDYQNARFSYPYLDKRVLEFCLAVDGRFKQREGRGRHLLRMGMNGLLPKAVSDRTSKAPFSPDYHRRYATEKIDIERTLKDINNSKKLNVVVDFERMLEALQKDPAYSPAKPMKADYNSQFLVPYGMYLCYFLSRFGISDLGDGGQS